MTRRGLETTDGGGCLLLPTFIVGLYRQHLKGSTELHFRHGYSFSWRSALDPHLTTDLLAAQEICLADRLSQTAVGSLRCSIVVAITVRGRRLQRQLNLDRAAGRPVGAAPTRP